MFPTEKYLKVDPKTRSYDILTKTYEKIPTILNMAKVLTTLGNGMIINFTKRNLKKRGTKPAAEMGLKILSMKDEYNHFEISGIWRKTLLQKSEYKLFC